jgi:5-methylcytosine-specific restriction endonuclease McrA
MGNWRDTARRDRLPPDWPAIRRRILTRDGHRCTWTVDGHRCAAVATDVDHRVNNDDDRDSNLRALCSYHHRKKTAAEGNAAKARLRAAVRRTPEAHPGGVG